LSEGTPGGWTAVDRLLDEALAARVGSAAEIVVRAGGEEVHRYAAGLARRVPTPRPLVDPPLWDLASVTKALVGAPVAWALIDEGALAFEDEAASIVPGAAPGVTIAQLLSHSSGYPPWSPLYEAVAPDAWGSPEAREQVIAAAVSTPLQSTPGEAHAYSDLGFLTLCAAAEAAGGDRLDGLWRRLVAGPLGLDEGGLCWAPGPRPDVVAVEDCPVRGGVVEGEVHDLNCASMGGIASHAGLFGTGRGVAAAGQAFLDRFLDRSHGGGSPAQVRAWTEGGAGSHRLGWDGVSRPSSTGDYFPDDAVGHLGFTGTSLWVIPSLEVVITLLTNRVHPALDTRIRTLRPAVHDAVMVALGVAGGAHTG